MSNSGRRQNAQRASKQAALKQYDCGPIRLTGSGDALYEQNLLLDSIVDPATVAARERYEAVARSVRDDHPHLPSAEKVRRVQPGGGGVCRNLFAQIASTQAYQREDDGARSLRG